MVKVELNEQGVCDLLRSQEMMNICRKEAQRVQQKCGKGYSVDEHIGKTRVNVSVGAVTQAARRENLKNNTLLKALL